MCLYITITCPGNCGTYLFSNELVSVCRSASIKCRPVNFEETHQIEHWVIPLSPNEVQQRFPHGYTCSEPSCSYHVEATFTPNINTLFRCPGCGFVHSRSGDVWVETWLGPNGMRVPFLDKTQWPNFVCSQRNTCHFNPAYRNELEDIVLFIQMEMMNSFNSAYNTIPWKQAEVDILRTMQAQGATVRDVATVLGRTEGSVWAKSIRLRKADGTFERFSRTWTAADEEMLRSMMAQGVSVSDIGAALGRSDRAVRTKWCRLVKSAAAEEPETQPEVQPKI